MGGSLTGTVDGGVLCVANDECQKLSLLFRARLRVVGCLPTVRFGQASTSQMSGAGALRTLHVAYRFYGHRTRVPLDEKARPWRYLYDRLRQIL
jgi:hypothetical protein